MDKDSNIIINAGQKRISINSDSDRIISFNPLDQLFIERFYQLISDFDAKDIEYRKRMSDLEAAEVLDKHGLPNNVPESLALMKEACSYIRERIDYIFGEGTSQIAFGDALNLDMFAQFFDGIVPFIQQTRVARIKKYTNRSSKVMK